MENISAIHTRLQQLGLSKNEAIIFLYLINEPKTPLEVSRATNIHRSNVYRIVDELMEKGLVCELSAPNGRSLASAKPEALELLVIEQERKAETQRADFGKLLSLLQNIKGHETDFATKSYIGVAGMKQMLWNELGTTTEILVFSYYGSLTLTTDERWAEKYRQEIITRGIIERNIENPVASTMPLTAHGEYTNHYITRYISDEVLAIKSEISIYDNTVSLYDSWTNSTKIGTEIKSPFLAAFMRQVFEHYWNLASK